MRLPPVADEPVDVGEREQPAHSDPDQRARPVYLEGIGGVHGGYSYRQAPTNFLKGGDPSCGARTFARSGDIRSEEHTSELQSLMRISYAVFCLNKKNNNTNNRHT